jgi:hypothetical protein
MTPVEPTQLHEGGHLVVFAKDQPEYKPLPASVDANGLVMTEWEPTAEELQMLLMGGRIRLWVHHAFGGIQCGRCGTMVPKLLSPIQIEAIEPECGMRW